MFHYPPFFHLINVFLKQSTKRSATAIGVILAGLTLYFLFQTGQLYNKIWLKILVYLIDAVWILIVLLTISLFIH